MCVYKYLAINLSTSAILSISNFCNSYICVSNVTRGLISLSVCLFCLSASALKEIDDKNFSLRTDCLLLYITKDAAVKTMGKCVEACKQKHIRIQEKVFFKVYKIHQEFC